jgi:hypothetical protein
MVVTDQVEGIRPKIIGSWRKGPIVVSAVLFEASQLWRGWGGFAVEIPGVHNGKTGILLQHVECFVCWDLRRPSD